MGAGSLPGVEAAGALGWTAQPHLVPKVLEKSRAIPLLTLVTFVAYKKGENRPYYYYMLPVMLRETSYLVRNVWYELM